MIQNLSPKLQNMLEILCHNLAQYNYLYQEYEPIHQMNSFDELLDFATEKNHKEAKARKQFLLDMNKLLLKEKNPNFKTYILNQIETIKNTFIGNIYQIADNKSFARHHTQKNSFLNEFEPVFADQKKEARPFDSVGKINLLGDYKNIMEIAKNLRFHYQVLNSIGPVFETHMLSDKAGHEEVHGLISEKKPPKAVYHQIWINEHLMLKATFKTNQSLAEYLSHSLDAVKSLIYLIAYTEEIYQNMGDNRSQTKLHQEYLNKRLYYTKMKTANYLEQYLLISTELFCKIIQELKTKNKLPTNVPVFDDINQLLPSNDPFSKDDIKKMETYLSIRDHFAHQTEYNFKPFSTLSPKTTLVKEFNLNMVHFLSKILNISKKTLNDKINSFKEDSHYDVYSLLLLMDMRKGLRNLCVQEANLPPDQPNVFLKLGFINKEENKELTKALKLRNDICHEKLDATLANKAQESSKKILPIIEKISNHLLNKFNISITHHYYPNLSNTPKSFQDIQKEFPFLNIDIQNDPDAQVLYEVLKDKKLDHQLIQKMYLLGHMIQNITLKNYSLQNNPYFEEKELFPFLNEYQSYSNTNKNNFRKHIFKALASVWLKEGTLPALKNDHQHD